MALPERALGNQTFNRRRILLGAVGLSSAALVGCGGNEKGYPIVGLDTPTATLKPGQTKAPDTSSTTATQAVNNQENPITADTVYKSASAFPEAPFQVTYSKTQFPYLNMTFIPGGIFDTYLTGRTTKTELIEKQKDIDPRTQYEKERTFSVISEPVKNGTLEKFKAGVLDQLRGYGTIDIVESKDMQFKGTNAWEFTAIYTSKLGGGQTKLQKILFISGGRAWQVGFEASTAAFDNLLPTVQPLLDSFKLGN